MRPDFCSPPAAPLGVSLSQRSCARRLMKASGCWRHRAVDLLRRARRGVSARESGYCELRSVCTSLLNKSSVRKQRVQATCRWVTRGREGTTPRLGGVTAYRKTGVFCGGSAGRTVVGVSDWRNLTCLLTKHALSSTSSPVCSLHLKRQRRTLCVETQRRTGEEVAVSHSSTAVSEAPDAYYSRCLSPALHSCTDVMLTLFGRSLISFISHPCFILSPVSPNYYTLHEYLYVF